MRKIIPSIFVTIIIIMIASIVWAEIITYTGKAEGVEIDYSMLNFKAGDKILTAMGIKYIVVIKDKNGNIIAKIPSRVGTGTMTVNETKQAINNDVKRKTQEVWAHTQGALEVIKSKTELENYNATCSEYIASALRGK